VAGGGAYMKVLDEKYYDRDTTAVARDLIGTKLIHEFKGRILSGMIIETEAYLGYKDSACHAYKRRTPRNSVMFGPSGVAYVYLVYGMHFMLNIVTEQIGNPCAVLIRAIEPIDGLTQMEALRGKKDKDLSNGPAKLCQAMAIDKSLNGWKVTKGKCLWLESYKKIAAKLINVGPRIGINYALPVDRDAPLRYWFDRR
jgi:DNA-3-methyladenine glycosylase